jgi:hypothetical protein
VEPIDTPTGPATAEIWWKSRRSGAQGNCVEVCRRESGDVAVRDSKHPDGPVLVFSIGAFAALTTGLRNGQISPLG